MAKAESVPPWWVDGGRYIKDDSQKVFYVAEMVGGSLWAESHAALIAHLRNTAEHYVAVAECLRDVIARVDEDAAAAGLEWVQSPGDAALEKRAREALAALDAAGGGDG